LLGYPEAALSDNDEALKQAREMGQAATLMWALAHAPIPNTLCGNYAAAAAHAQELVALAEEKGSVLWKGIGMMNQGGVLALTGRAADAVEILISGIAAWRMTGATVWMPYYLPHLARAHAEVRQFEEAWRSVSEAMTAAETTKEKWCEADIHRMAGEITLMSPESDAVKAEAHFERTIAIASEQRAKSLELRAATSMARLWREQGKRQQARDLLAPICAWFTEGFDTPDLTQAKALVDELRAEGQLHGTPASFRQLERVTAFHPSRAFPVERALMGSDCVGPRDVGGRCIKDAIKLRGRLCAAYGRRLSPLSILYRQML
jgi:predicted ATPase